MPAVTQVALANERRKRRAHAKSRKGCGTCKLRRVKCDEARPKCKKCVSYGVVCDYDGSSPTVDTINQDSFQIDLSRGEATIDFSMAPDKPPVSLNKMSASMINHSLLNTAFHKEDNFILAGMPHMARNSVWSFTESDMETMTRFQTRTVSTIGTREASATYADCIAHLAFSHPFLMHMVLSLTLMHDAYLISSPTSPLATTYQKASLTHWNTATKLFNTVLSRAIPPSYRDAIWATGALLGTASMAYIESSRPEDAWPLKPPDPNDLSWLKLSEGKRAVWKIANPTRPESMFHQLGKIMNHRVRPAWLDDPNFDAVPETWARLFDIRREDTHESNVYYSPVLCVLSMTDLELTRESVFPFISFLLYMTPEFRARLEVKDPRAMLLLLWWFRRVQDGANDIWWMTRRARVEGRAIEIWLDRWYGGEEGLMRMFETVRGGAGGQVVGEGGGRGIGGREDPASVLRGCVGWGMVRSNGDVLVM